MAILEHQSIRTRAARKALCIGIRYDRAECQSLKSTYADVAEMRKLLGKSVPYQALEHVSCYVVERMGYQDEDVRFLQDDGTGAYPDRSTIVWSNAPFWLSKELIPVFQLAEMERLLEGALPHDHFVFHCT